MDNLEKAEFTALIHHVARFLKPGIPIYNFKGYGWQNNQKKNTDNCKALCISCKYKKKLMKTQAFAC